MSNINTLIEEYMTGDAWEELCQGCYRLKHQDEKFIFVPANHGGDAGIEGYTKSGIVYQCYCPEKVYSDDDLYEKLRDKVTTDINKLKKNGERLKKLGVPPIKEWHFVTPKYKDPRILSHITSKEEEIRKFKIENPTECTHIDDKFQIVIKIAEDFYPQISMLLRNNITKYRLSVAISGAPTTTWKDCESQKVINIQRKIKAVMQVDDIKNPRLEQMVDIYMNYYIMGIENMNKLRNEFPDIYEDLFNLEQSYKNEVKMKALMNTDKLLNKNVFDEILEKFQSKLIKDFSNIFSEAAILELKQDLVASWLANCSMEFIGSEISE